MGPLSGSQARARACPAALTARNPLLRQVGVQEGHDDARQEHVKSKPQFRAGAPGGAAPCKRSPRARRPREPEEHKEVPMESYPPPQQAAKQISHTFVAWYLSSFADIGSEWHCPCSRPRCCGISKLWPLHVGVNGVATPVPYLCRSAACHGVSIVSSKLFPSMLT